VIGPRGRSKPIVVTDDEREPFRAWEKTNRVDGVNAKGRAPSVSGQQLTGVESAERCKENTFARDSSHGGSEEEPGVLCVREGARAACGRGGERRRGPGGGRLRVQVEHKEDS
jgi:hypothetical protein